MIKKIFLILLLLLQVRTVFADVPETKPEMSFEVARTEDKKETQDSLKERRKHNQLSKNEKRIYALSMRPNVVYRLQTALGYTTTIDLPEPALKVFVGDQDLFKVEVYEKEVVVKPITDEPDARTNLVIFTQNSRVTFDVLVGSPETTDFVMDFKLKEEDAIVGNAFKKKISEAEEKLKEEYEKKESGLDEKAKALSEEKFMKKIIDGNSVIALNETKEVGQIKVYLVSLSSIGDKCYLRFSIRNLSDSAYRIREMALAVQTYKRKWFGLRKEKEGLIEIPAHLEIENPIARGEWHYGVLEFEKRALKKGEGPVLYVFEDGGVRHVKFDGFHWVG